MDIARSKPKVVVNSTAPIRICDNGGWTDTWFAKHGKIFNIGVQPLVEVQIAVYGLGELIDCKAAPCDPIIMINAENYGEKYLLGTRQSPAPNLLEAVIEHVGLSVGYDYEITVFSPVPPGAATGTSAAVAVALLGGLYSVKRLSFSPIEVATMAHRIETEVLQQQSGIQDQLCSAYGGINYIEMDEYPHVVLKPLNPPDEFWWELERRLVLIYLGKSHSSSRVHEMVIKSLAEGGSESRQLDKLRLAAERSRDAILATDFEALGRAMIDNTQAQYELHPKLISEEAQRVIAVACEFGALGWKVNGAGGDGGSLTILCDQSSPRKREMIRNIMDEVPISNNIPITLSRFGLRTWQMKTSMSREKE